MEALYLLLALLIALIVILIINCIQLERLKHHTIRCVDYNTNRLMDYIDARNQPDVCVALSTEELNNLIAECTSEKEFREKLEAIAEKQKNDSSKSETNQ